MHTRIPISTRSFANLFPPLLTGCFTCELAKFCAMQQASHYFESDLGTWKRCWQPSRDSDVADFCKRLPKAELHAHLNGSIRLVQWRFSPIFIVFIIASFSPRTLHKLLALYGDGRVLASDCLLHGIPSPQYCLHALKVTDLLLLTALKVKRCLSLTFPVVTTLSPSPP